VSDLGRTPSVAAGRRCENPVVHATARPTPFTELVGCRMPVQLAAMGGGVTTPELVAAAARGGRLGSQL
jgi:enoyl reductase-like protein